jgi:hypothetical protein
MYHKMDKLPLYRENVLDIHLKYIFTVKWYLVSVCIHILVQWPDDDIYWSLKLITR